MRKLLSRTTTRRGARKPSFNGKKRDAIWAVVFLAPALVAIFSLRIAPALQALWSSFFKALPGGLSVPFFAGGANYRHLFGNPEFLETFLRTLVFNLVINPLQVAIALLLAILMTRKLALTGLWRTLLFIPATIPIVGSSIAWGAILRQDGPMNAILSVLGVTTQPFLTSPSQALASIMLIATWIGVGYWMIFLITGIENIPREYYEAASIDRAGPLRTFWSITLPLLKRQLLFVLVADTVANFVLFVPIQMLTNGGPENTTTLLMFDAYRTTYGYGNRNLGAAEVVILTLIMLIFVGLQFWLLRDRKDV